MVDEPGAIWIPSPNYFANRNGYTPKWIIVHGTAGFNSARDVGTYFQTADVSANYVVGQDGTIVQCVAEKDGAWGNGVISAGHDSWWTEAINPNWVTISIEHVKPHTDNSDTITPAQEAATFRLISHICDRHNIRRAPATAEGGITGHFSIDPVNRSRCPGPYPFDRLFPYLNNGGSSVQQFTKDSSDFKQFGFSEDASGMWHQGGFVIGHAMKTLYASLSPDGQALPVPGLPKSNERYVTWSRNGKSGVVSLIYFERMAFGYNVSGAPFDTQPGFNSAYIAHQDDPIVRQNAPWYQPPAPGPVVEKIPQVVVDDIKAVDAANTKLKQDAKIS